MKSKTGVQIILLMIAGVLTSCGTPAPTPVNTLEASSTSVRPSAPSTSKPAPTHTSAPTPTKLATLSPEDAYTTLEELIQGDANCALPCWFGVIPGRTNFIDAGNILSQFSAVATTDFSSRWADISVKYPTYRVTTTVYPTKDGKAGHILVDTSINWDANGRVLYDDPSFRETWQRYFMPELLTRYGVPEKIFLDTTLLAADPGSSYAHVLWVVYEQPGFLIRYEGDNSKVGNNIRICPLQSKITIKLWDPETSSYEEHIEGDMAMATSLGPQPLESVTEFDIDSFYEKFKGGNFDTCFETPASIWPQ